MKVEDRSRMGILYGFNEHTGTITKGRLRDPYVRRYFHRRHHRSEVRAHLLDGLWIGWSGAPQHGIHFDYFG